MATNADLSTTEITKVAQMVHNGLTRVIHPVHTMFDGDTIFALLVGVQAVPANTVGAIAVEVMEEAVSRAVEWGA